MFMSSLKLRLLMFGLQTFRLLLGGVAAPLNVPFNVWSVFVCIALHLLPQLFTIFCKGRGDSGGLYSICPHFVCLLVGWLVGWLIG